MHILFFFSFTSLFSDTVCKYAIGKIAPIQQLKLPHADECDIAIPMCLGMRQSPKHVSSYIGVMQWTALVPLNVIIIQNMIMKQNVAYVIT